jgi:UDP-2-acetamido-2-deoxy-ribo-hexuluronate aminotransferase
MEFIDLKAQYHALKAEIDAGIAQVVESGTFISGPQVKELENKLAHYVGVSHCVCCANGTDALELVLLALGIGPGDAVFVPSFTFMSTAEVVAYHKATPVFVDVDEHTFNMDPQSLRQAIEATLAEGRLTPKGIITVDLFGLPANYPAIEALAAEYGLRLLEDGAQGFGGSIHGRRACSFGDAATTSFFPAKPLGCYGDGGAIFTNDDNMALLLRSLCVHGKGTQKYDNIRIGRNSRLDTLQAAILLPKLSAFERYELSARNHAAAIYTQRLSERFQTPLVPEGFGSSWAQYTLRMADASSRDSLQAHLREAGIPSMVYYPRALHQQPAYQDIGKYFELPAVSQRLTEQVLCLPMHPYLEEKTIHHICDVLLNA